MSQHDYNIANGGGAAVRADLNLALAAVLSQNSGATAPTTTKPFMPWYDTTTGILKIRNAADDAWVTFAAGAIQDASIAQAKLAANVAGNGPAFSAYCNSSQSLSAATLTKGLFAGVEYDTTGGMYASSRFTPTVAGYYLVNAAFQAATVNADLRIFAYRDGASIKNISTSVGAANWTCGSCVVYLNGSTNYLEIYLYSTAANTTNATQQSTYFQATLIRSA